MLGASRLANEAQIRVLFSDKQADLQLNDWNADPSQEVQLSTLAPEVTASTQTSFTINGHAYYLAESACGTSPAPSVGSACTNGDTRFVQPPNVLGDATATQVPPQAEWPLINGWLLVEAKWASDGKWHGITKEWLGLGFARGLALPSAPGTNSLTVVGSGANTDMRNAILYLQVQADRNGVAQLLEETNRQPMNLTRAWEQVVRARQTQAGEHVLTASRVRRQCRFERLLAPGGERVRVRESITRR